MERKKVLFIGIDPQSEPFNSLKGYEKYTIFSSESNIQHDFIKMISPDVFVISADSFADASALPEGLDEASPVLVYVKECQKIPEKTFYYANDFIMQNATSGELEFRLERISKKKELIAVNRLTNLPSGYNLWEKVRKCISGNKAYALCCIDLDNFKAYNERYGYEKGDELLKGLAEMLKKTVRSLEEESYFLAHSNSDDFYIIAPSEKCEELAKLIIKNFENCIKKFYTRPDSDRGFIEILDRRNRVVKFPVMSVTVAIIQLKKDRHYAKILQSVDELKRYGKELPTRNGSIYIRDRRL